jgi:hypothetical protein
VTLTDARGRIVGGDLRYGRLCACGNLKGWQSRVCRRCYLEAVHDEEFWARRRCECGGPKAIDARRCRHCANERLRGVSVPGREQPQSHPWRKAA